MGGATGRFSGGVPPGGRDAALERGSAPDGTAATLPPPSESPAATERWAVVGLGANIGYALGFLRAARARLGAFLQIEAASRVYRTAPWGGVPQSDFLNAALCGRCVLSPEALLTALQGIETALGRQRHTRYGPRHIDLDLLYYEGVQQRTSRLHLPHPELHLRDFAWQPFSEVLPEALSTADPTLQQLLVKRTQTRASGAFSRPQALTPYATPAWQRL